MASCLDLMHQYQRRGTLAEDLLQAAEVARTAEARSEEACKRLLRSSPPHPPCSARCPGHPAAAACGVHCQRAATTRVVCAAVRDHAFGGPEKVTPLHGVSVVGGCPLVLVGPGGWWGYRAMAPQGRPVSVRPCCNNPAFVQHVVTVVLVAREVEAAEVDAADCARRATHYAEGEKEASARAAGLKLDVQRLTRQLANAHRCHPQPSSSFALQPGAALVTDRHPMPCTGSRVSAELLQGHTSWCTDVPCALAHCDGKKGGF